MTLLGNFVEMFTQEENDLFMENKKSERSMRGYAELHDCRREYLLNYLGEKKDDPCGFCDNCEAGISMKEDEHNLAFPINSRVVHKS